MLESEGPIIILWARLATFMGQGNPWTWEFLYHGIESIIHPLQRIPSFHVIGWTKKYFGGIHSFMFGKNNEFHPKQWVKNVIFAFLERRKTKIPPSVGGMIESLRSEGIGDPFSI